MNTSEDNKYPQGTRISRRYSLRMLPKSRKNGVIYHVRTAKNLASDKNGLAHYLRPKTTGPCAEARNPKWKPYASKQSAHQHEIFDMEFGVDVTIFISSDSRYRQIGTRLELTEVFIVDEFLFVLDGTIISFFRKPLNEQLLQLQKPVKSNVNAMNIDCEQHNMKSKGRKNNAKFQYRKIKHSSQESLKV